MVLFLINVFVCVCVVRVFVFCDRCGGIRIHHAVSSGWQRKRKITNVGLGLSKDLGENQGDEMSYEGDVKYELHVSKLQ